MTSKTTGVLFVNLGGPDSLEAVEPFLMNLFCDPEILELPFSFLLQKPIATAIVKARLKTVRESYRHMGGRSPILPLTEAQARALKDHLRQDGIAVKVYIAMRYWHPYTHEALAQMEADGIEQVIVLPMYPQFSLASTGSSFSELRRELGKRAYPFTIAYIQDYHQNPDYIGAIAALIQDGLDTCCWSCPKEQVQLIFSAHSLPEKFVKKTGDVYPAQIMETIRAVTEQYFPDQPWELAFQSRVGRMKWLGPPVDGILHYFAALHTDNLLLIPISFVSDHLETLYEIDVEYLRLAKELGIPHCHRAKVPNTYPRFIHALAGLVKAELAKPAARPSPVLTS